MAYNGEFSYMDLSYGSVEWSNAVKCFPDIPSKLELEAPVREFVHCTIELQNQTTNCAIFAGGDESDERWWLKFDVEDMPDIQRLKCIVVGREFKWAGQRTDEQSHYVRSIGCYETRRGASHLYLVQVVNIPHSTSERNSRGFYGQGL